MSLIELDNPWTTISADDYERHMSHESIMQLQALNKIFEKQYHDYVPKKLIYLGICTGNGLEHVKNGITQKTYGIDINPEYLKLCAKRYSSKIQNLILKQIDLNQDCFSEDVADLVIANLVLEFVDLDRFIEQIIRVDNGNTVVSIVFQIKNKVPIVSNSGVDSMNILSDYHKEITFHELNVKMEANLYAMIKNYKIKLPDGKEFVRVDYRNNRAAHRQQK